MLLVLGAFALWTRTAQPAPLAPSPRDVVARSVPAATDVAPEPEPPAVVAETTPEPTRSSDPEPVAAPTRTVVDPCERFEVDAAVDRPSIGTLVDDRVAELNDRMRAAMRRPTSSEALREGLRLGVAEATADEGLQLLRTAPDRVEDGFDYRVATLSVLATHALARGDHRRARTLALSAAREAPDDPLPLALEARADEALGDPVAASEALARAHALDPSEPSIALELAHYVRDGADPVGAVAVFDAYLREMPDDTLLRRNRERLARRVEVTRGFRTTRRRGLTILAPSETDAHAVGTALDTIDAALTRSATLLGVTRPTHLTVIAYRTREEMRVATCGQSWTAAMYDGVLHFQVADAVSEEGRVALAHEAVHATLRSALPTVRVPTWLNEGIAQYATAERGGGEHSFRLMVDEHAVIPFESMDGAFMVIDDPTDVRLAYHQALAMVLWLVHQRGERGIADAIDWLAEGGVPENVLREVSRTTLTADGLREFLATEELHR